MKHWPVQDAKARFSELLREAGKEPQRITVRGEPAAVLISESEYRRLTGEVRSPEKDVCGMVEIRTARAGVPSCRLVSVEKPRKLDL